MKPWIKSLTLAVTVALSFAIAPSTWAGDDDAPQGRLTFFKDVLPILQQNCQECHRPGGSQFTGMGAPMALVSYEEVRPWAKSIVQKITEGAMPPWYASDEFNGVFELERHLSDVDREKIVRWVDTGAVRGNPADAPAPREFESGDGWAIGKPDLIIQMPEPHWVADDVLDEQLRFPLVLTEEMLPEDRWIHAIQVMPGSEIVHHMGARTTPLGEDGEPIDDPLSGGKIIGTAPGDGPDVWPIGYGKLLRKGSLFTFGLHYHKEPGPGTGVWDQSSIGIVFHDVEKHPVKHVVRATGISSRGWEIPPHHNFWEVGAAQTFERDTAIINMMPHMHFRGRAAKYVAFYPDGSSEVLLDVPFYEYTWQMTYSYKEPKILPAGTRIEVSMWFDNSADNGYNPDPTIPMDFGPATDDEMNIGWFEYANAEPIDDIMNAHLQNIGTGVEDVDAVDVRSAADRSATETFD